MAALPSVRINGALPKYARRQFRETGLLVDSASFSPEIEVMALKANDVEALRATRQVQEWIGDLQIEIKGQAVSNAEGRMHGLAAVLPGDSVICAHFAAAVIEDGVETAPAISRFGFTRDLAKLLMVREPKLDLGDTTDVTLGMTYYRYVDAGEIALAAA
jgi:hypothetical protein